MPTLDGFLEETARSRPTAAIVLDEPVSIEALQTPALVIDQDAFERNLHKMQDYTRRHGIALRPHTKMHKCPLIARQQLAAGAVGVCAAKVSEAEVMYQNGIEEILMTTTNVTPTKIRRAMALSQVGQSSVSIKTDKAGGIERSARATSARGRADAAASPASR